MYACRVWTRSGECFVYSLAKDALLIAVHTSDEICADDGAHVCSSILSIEMYDAKTGRPAADAVAATIKILYASDETPPSVEERIGVHGTTRQTRYAEDVGCKMDEKTLGSCFGMFLGDTYPSVGQLERHVATIQTSQHNTVFDVIDRESVGAANPSAATFLTHGRRAFTTPVILPAALLQTSSSKTSPVEASSTKIATGKTRRRDVRLVVLVRFVGSTLPTLITTDQDGDQRAMQFVDCGRDAAVSVARRVFARIYLHHVGAGDVAVVGGSQPIRCVGDERSWGWFVTGIVVGVGSVFALKRILDV